MHTAVRESAVGGELLIRSHVDGWIREDRQRYQCRHTHRRGTGDATGCRGQSCCSGGCACHRTGTSRRIGDRRCRRIRRVPDDGLERLRAAASECSGCDELLSLSCCKEHATRCHCNGDQSRRRAQTDNPLLRRYRNILVHMIGEHAVEVSVETRVGRVRIVAADRCRLAGYAVYGRCVLVEGGRHAYYQLRPRIRFHK